MPVPVISQTMKVPAIKLKNSASDSDKSRMTKKIIASRVKNKVSESNDFNMMLS